MSNKIKSVPVVNRDNYINTIVDLYSEKVSVVFMDGIDGIGKSALAKQFAEKNQNTVPLFLNTPSKWGYDLVIVRGILLKYSAKILGEEVSLPAEGDLDTEWQAMVRRLHKLALRNERVYFVVDGLDLLSKEESDLANSILDLLPIGLDGFRILISRNIENSELSAPNRVEDRNFTVPRFSMPDTKAFFLNLNCGEITELTRIHNICDGIPGKLASIRRSLEGGVNITELLGQNSPALISFFEVEWQHFDPTNEDQARLLSLLAHVQNPMPWSLVERFLKDDQDSLAKSIRELTFVSDDSENVQFVDEAFVHFAAKKLEGMKSHALNMVIDDLLESPDDELRFTQLPVFMENAGRTDDLFGLLNPEFFSAALERLRSLSPLRKSAEIALDAAKRKENDKFLFQFALNKCVLQELDGADIWRSEVEATLARGEIEKASLLANSVELKEAKFELLSAVASHKRQAGLAVGPDLTSQIETSFHDVDTDSLGDRKKRIAQDLAFVCPIIAEQLFESMGRIDADVSIVNTIIGASLAENDIRDHDSKSENFEGLQNQISNPKLRLYGEIVPRMIRSSTASEIISDLKKIESLEFRLRLSKGWVAANRTSAECIGVVKFALDEVIRSTIYTPNARDIRDLMEVLKNHANEAGIDELIVEISKLDESLRKNGPTYDYVRLLLLIVETKLAKNCSLENEVDSIRAFIVAIRDQTTKTECIASFYSFLSAVDEAKQIDGFDELLEETTKSLEENFDHLVNSSASQYKVCSKTIRILSRSSLSLAVKYAEKLNTEYRRDLVKADIAKANFRANNSQSDFEGIDEVISTIKTPTIKSQGLASFWSNIRDDRAHYGEYKLEDIQPFIGLLDLIEDAEERCEAISNAIEFLCIVSVEGASLGQVGSLVERLKKDCEAIDVEWVRIRTAFSIATILADSCPVESERFLVEGRDLKTQTNIHSSGTAWAAAAAARLAVSAFSGLLIRKKDSDEDLAKLKMLIDAIPSRGERAVLWADVAQRFFIAKRLDDAQQVTNSRILPLWDAISDRDKQYKDHILIQIAQVLYSVNSITAKERIARLSPNERDRAYRQIINFKLRKEPIFEPYEAVPGKGFEISHDEATAICELLQEVEDDSLIGYVSCVLTDSALNNKNRFTREHKSDLASRLQSIANEKLPSPRFLQHKGYVYFLELMALKLKRFSRPDFEQLIADVKTMSNVADRVLVTGEIACALKPKHAALRDELVSVFEGDWQTIPALLDKTGRLQAFAENIQSFDRGKAKSFNEQAMALSKELGTTNAKEIQRKILDSVHRTDPDGARELVKAFDDDEARVENRKEFEKRLTVLDRRKSMHSDETASKLGAGGKNNQQMAVAELPRLAWISLGSLNAGRSRTLRPKEIRNEIYQAASLPISESYPILSWAIANAAKLYEDTDNVVSLLRPLFESTVMSGQLTNRVIERAACNSTRTTKFVDTMLQREKTLIVGPDDRAKVMNFIKEWSGQFASDYLKICDPYFGIDELEILKLVHEINPSMRFTILTSIGDREFEGQDLAEEFKSQWRTLSVSDPPDADFIMLGTKSNNYVSPIHDRVWVSNEYGLEFGSSLNSTGVANISKISRLDEFQTREWEIEIDKFVNRTTREHRGQKLEYRGFTL